MREAVEKSDRQQNESMTRLDQSIKENLKQAREVGERADKLANALTSENKTQGNFGELRLKQVLENMGLEEGLQFEEQVTMKDEHGQTIYEEGRSEEHTSELQSRQYLVCGLLLDKKRTVWHSCGSRL